jgi:hypothetical protein
MITITAEFKANGHSLQETIEFHSHATPTQVTRVLKRIYNKPTIMITDVVITKIVDNSLVEGIR